MSEILKISPDFNIKFLITSWSTNSNFKAYAFIYEVNHNKIIYLLNFGKKYHLFVALTTPLLKTALINFMREHFRRSNNVRLYINNKKSFFITSEFFSTTKTKVNNKLCFCWQMMRGRGLIKQEIIYIQTNLNTFCKWYTTVDI